MRKNVTRENRYTEAPFELWGFSCPCVACPFECVTWQRREAGTAWATPKYSRQKSRRGSGRSKEVGTSSRARPMRCHTQ